MAGTSAEIVGLGEILWDLLPAGRQLGGAPFNFTFHCHQLGRASVMVSRIGADDLGRDIRDAVRQLGLCDTYLQEDAQHPTGTVDVKLDATGQPSYIINPEVAYDYLAWDDTLQSLIGGAQAICFGTLIQRSPVARATIQRVLQTARGRLVVYDINLRQQFYTREIIEASLRACRWVKLNSDELAVLRQLFGLTRPGDSGGLSELRTRFDVELACLTRGAHGCLVQTADEEIVVPGLPVKVVDTVGAGDSFTAGLLVYALEGRPLADAAVFANRLAARVAGSAGGTPRLDRSAIEREP
jgi:fructokinase